MRCVYPENPADEQPWTVLEQAWLLRAQPFLDLCKEKVALPGGRIVEDFYVVHCLPVCVIVAETPEGEVVLHRKYRHGLRAMAWSLPGGTVEEGESLLEGAQRELLEETGFAAPEWTVLGHSFQDGNRRGYAAHIFLARGAWPNAEVASPDLENAQVWLASWREVLDLVARNAFPEMGAWSSLLRARFYLDRNEDKPR